MIRRNSEGGVILSDDEQAAIVKCLAASAIHQFIEGGWEDVPELAEGAWNAIADDFDQLGDVLLIEADGIASAAGFDIDNLMVAITESSVSYPQVTPDRKAHDE